MTEGFREYLKAVINSEGFQKITEADTLIVHKRLVEDLKKIEKARGGFSHEWITLKSKGRVVLPDNLRTAIGATEGTRFDAHLYPNPQRPRGIVLLKEE